MHDDDDDHAPIEHDDGPPGEPEILAAAVHDLLVEKGVFTAAAVREMIETVDGRTPATGAKLVARAWIDPAFKARLLADGKATAAEFDIDVGVANLVVVENTASVHNLIVCTLCSCYPVMVLGRSPEWYKSKAYRARAVREPGAVLAEFGTAVADAVEVRVHDSTADMRYLVLPERPAGTEGLSEDALAALVTRDSMIGVGRPRAAGGA